MPCTSRRPSTCDAQAGDMTRGPQARVTRSSVGAVLVSWESAGGDILRGGARTRSRREEALFASRPARTLKGYGGWRRRGRAAGGLRHVSPQWVGAAASCSASRRCQLRQQ